MRSRNMQRLTDQLKARYPGIVVYGIGDDAHKLSPSGHNEDDTPGSRPEQEDPDSVREHRAIDPMLRGAFTAAAAWAFVLAMVTVDANRRRLLYVIHKRQIWAASAGWAARAYAHAAKDPHDDHVHLSGTWPDDDNTSDWILDVPTVPARNHRRRSMSTLYFNLTKRNQWALAGDSPGTPANWLTTGDQSVANGWAEAHGSAVGLYQESYDEFRGRYQSPVQVVDEQTEAPA